MTVKRVPTRNLLNYVDDDEDEDVAAVAVAADDDADAAAYNNIGDADGAYTVPALYRNYSLFPHLII